MLLLKLGENPETGVGIISGVDFLPVLRTSWEGNQQGRIWQGGHPRTAQRIDRRLSLPWSRVHAKGSPTVDEERRTAFLEGIRELLRRVPRSGMIDADETSFGLYMTGFYRWAGRGAK
jgi:hypothetical protein